MRFRLRTLLILVALSPPILAAIGIALFGLNRKPPEPFGTVTYRGMPVASGTVWLIPQFGPTQSFGMTTDAEGRYRFNREDWGWCFKPGRYRVNIDFPGNGQRHPSELTVEIRSETENHFNFDLQ